MQKRKDYAMMFNLGVVRPNLGGLTLFSKVSPIFNRKTFKVVCVCAREVGE